MEKKPEVGVIAGSFAVIHVGYIRMLREAQDSCRDLFILLHDDPTIERPHKNKPVHTSAERKEILQMLCPDAMILKYNTEKELFTLLKAIDLDVRFMGDDYQGKSYTGDDLGIPVHWINRSHGWSSTDFINKLIENRK